MIKSTPPARWTARHLRWLRAALRLRGAFAAMTIAALGSAAIPAAARPTTPLRVLLATSVTDQAQATMPTDLWTKFMTAYVNVATVPYEGNTIPTVADCHQAHADYLVVAGFDLRPRLPGLPNASDRIAAMTHLVVTDCITASVVLDQMVDFDSDPEVTWARDVPSALAKYPVVFDRIAHIVGVQGPFAFVKAGSVDALDPGDSLRDFATPDHRPRQHPIVLTVTAVSQKYLKVSFASNGDRPHVGDLIELLPKTPDPAHA